MNQGELKQYLKEVSDLEAQLYTYRKIEHIYQKELRILEREKNTIYYKNGTENIPENRRRRNFTIPTPEAKVNYLGERVGSNGRKESTFGFRGTYDMFKDIPERWWSDELRKLEGEERKKFKRIHVCVSMGTLLLGSLFALFLRNVMPLIVAVMAGLLICYLIGNEESREYLPGNLYYEKFMYFYQKQYEKELEEKARIYDPQIAFVEREYKKQVVPYIAKTERLLEKLYAKEIILGKYRNMAAVAQMYDYLDSGRCTALEGEKGAYALYETELQTNSIIQDFDISMYHLEKYNQVMPTMVSQIKSVNYILNNVLTQVKEGKSNTALTEFTAQCRWN